MDAIGFNGEVFWGKYTIRCEVPNRLQLENCLGDLWIAIVVINDA